jgi:hypothetical protein
MNSPKWTDGTLLAARIELIKKLQKITKWSDFYSLGPEYIVGLWPFHGGRYVVTHTTYNPPGSYYADRPPNTCVLGGELISNNKFEDSFSFSYAGGREQFHSFYVYETSTTSEEHESGSGTTSFVCRKTELVTIEPAVMRCVILNVFEYEPGEEREEEIEQALDVRDRFFEKETHEVKGREISLFCIES